MKELRNGKRKKEEQRMNIDDIYIGQVYEVKRIVTDEMVKLFAEATGDKNLCTLTKNTPRIPSSVGE